MKRVSVALIGGREAGSLDHGTTLMGLSPTEDVATALSIVDLLVGRGQRGSGSAGRAGEANVGWGGRRGGGVAGLGGQAGSCAHWRKRPRQKRLGRRQPRPASLA